MLLHHDDDYMQDRQTDRNRDTRERQRDTKMETERQRHNDDAQLLLRLWLERWSTKASGTVQVSEFGEGVVAADEEEGEAAFAKILDSLLHWKKFFPWNL